MKTRTEHGFIAALPALGLALNIYAAEPPKVGPTATSKDMTWTLSTDDTELTLAVANNVLSLPQAFDFVEVADSVRP